MSKAVASLKFLHLIYLFQKPSGSVYFICVPLICGSPYVCSCLLYFLSSYMRVFSWHSASWYGFLVQLERLWCIFVYNHPNSMPSTATTLPLAMAYLSLQVTLATGRSVGWWLPGNVETDSKVCENIASLAIIWKSKGEFMSYAFEQRVINMTSHWKSRTLDKMISYLIKSSFTLRNTCDLSLLSTYSLDVSPS